MRKIINDHPYNTETAFLVGTCGDDLTDFYCTTEALYRTRDGRWFVHCTSSACQASGLPCTIDQTFLVGECLYTLAEHEVSPWATSHNCREDMLITIAALLNLPEA